MIYERRYPSFITRFTSIFLLVLLFVSSAAHTHDFSNIQIASEQQECKLCHHSLDKSPQKTSLAPIILGEFNALSDKIALCNTAFPQYILPLLRAPPVYA